jgi:transposase
MKPYSEDLRERIVKARKQGQSVIELSKRYSVSKSSVERYCHLHAKTGGCSPGRMGGYRRSRLEGHDKTLRGWIQKRADLTLAELQVRCRERLGVCLGINALWHRLERLGLSYKKNAARRRAKPARH